MPLIGAQEIDVPSGTKLCIRVMAHVTHRPSTAELRHVYLEGAKVLRSDWTTDPGTPANVIGVGLIGGSIGMALRQRGWRVYGSDASDATLAKALELGAIDEVGLDAVGGDHVRRDARDRDPRSTHVVHSRPGARWSPTSAA